MFLLSNSPPATYHISFIFPYALHSFSPHYTRCKFPPPPPPALSCLVYFSVTTFRSRVLCISVLQLSDPVSCVFQCYNFQIPCLVYFSVTTFRSRVLCISVLQLSDPVSCVFQCYNFQISCLVYFSVTTFRSCVLCISVLQLSDLVSCVFQCYNFQISCLVYFSVTTFRYRVLCISVLQLSDLVSCVFQCYNFQTMLIGVDRGTSVQDLLEMTCSKRQLNPRDHYVRIKPLGSTDNTFVIPDKHENIKKLVSDDIGWVYSSPHRCIMFVSFGPGRTVFGMEVSI